jgi:hypothetical protein
MWHRLAAICALSICTLDFVSALPAEAADGPCSLTIGLGEQLSKMYPTRKVVELRDLVLEDREWFQRAHGNECAGLVRIDFYGDGRPTWALVLIAGHGPKAKADLVVAHQVDRNWEIVLLDTADEPAPVVWSEPSGEYRDIYGDKTIHAIHPVIVFAGYESWAILYAWNGKRMQKIWLAD